MSIGASLGLNNINWFASVSQIIYWVLYGFLGLVLVLFFFGVYYYISFKYKVEVYTLYGSSSDNHYSIGKKRTNRVKWNKDKTAWHKMFPLFSKKTIEPFDDQYIYTGNRIIAFELNKEWFPGRIDISSTAEGGKKGEIKPVPYWVRNWQSLEHKQNSMDFAKHDFWADNKNFIWMLLAVAICCSLCLATIYFSYKFAGGGVGAMDRLSSALQTFGGSSTAPPG